MKKRQDVKIIGIVNCTNASFHQPEKTTTPKKAAAYALQLIEEGADSIDLGAVSTNPNSKPLSLEEETDKICETLYLLRPKCSVPLSIDSYSPSVIEKALDLGANWINDITGFSNPKMIPLAKRAEKICVMHMQSAPHLPASFHYPNGVLQELLDFFKNRIRLLLEAGVEKDKITIDPGIGGGAFGKTPLQSLKILKHIEKLQTLGFPLYLGISRKSFMQKLLGVGASEVLSTTLAINTMCMLKGVKYFRVHDVQEHRHIVTILNQMDAIDE